MSARVSFKVATNGFFRDKRTSKINIFKVIILNQKRRNATEVIHVFEIFFGRFIPSSALYFLEASARVLLKEATKVLLELNKS